jgi:peptidoglycan/LPS O-acetylase OafA/YrhL
MWSYTAFWLKKFSPTEKDLCMKIQIPFNPWKVVFESQFRRDYQSNSGNLRAIAAFWVVVFHSAIILSNGSKDNWPKSNNWITSIIFEGWLGVSLFIVLSGYQLGCAVIDQRIRWSYFIFARFLRIYPLYLIVLILSYLESLPPVRQILFDIFLIPRTPSQSCCLTGLSATVWTVRVEFVLYLILPLLIFLIKKYSYYFVICVFGINLFVGSFFDSMDYFYWQVPGRLNEFLFGVALSKFLQNKIMSGKVLRILLFLGIAVVALLAKIINLNGGELLVDRHWGVVNLFSCIGFTLILLGSMSKSEKAKATYINRTGKYLAELSYGVYLYHFAIILFLVNHQPIDFFFGKNAISGAAVGAFIIYPITLALSFLTHPIEKYFMRLRPTYWTRK